MAYLHKGGTNISKLTFSAWIKTSAAEIAAAFSAGSASWGAARRRLPLFTLGTTRDGGTSGETAHVDAEWPVYITGDAPGPLMVASNNVAGITLPSYITSYVTSTGYTVPAGGGFIFMEPNPSGMSGSTKLFFYSGSTLQITELATLCWDFSGVKYLGRSPASITWGPSNPFSGALSYSFDVTNSTNTVAISPTVIYIDSDGPSPSIRLAEYLGGDSRNSPNQRFLSFDEFGGGTFVDGWNHLFVTVDLTDQSSVKAALVLNNGNKTVQTSNAAGIFGAASPLPAIGGEQMGFGTTPQESAASGHFSSGVNPRSRFAYVQVWLNQYIEPTDANLEKFFRIVDEDGASVLKPPLDRDAAQTEFGKSDIYFYRDRNAKHEFISTGWTKSGTSPKDHFPGPGQRAA